VGVPGGGSQSGFTEIGVGIPVPEFVMALPGNFFEIIFGTEKKFEKNL
jgi:hypothetical protein